MDDVKRFLRFTFPGITSVIFLLAALIISDYNALNMRDHFTYSNSNIVGIVFGLFIASGGLGYIYSQIYWGLY